MTENKFKFKCRIQNRVKMDSYFSESFSKEFEVAINLIKEEFNIEKDLKIEKLETVGLGLDYSTDFRKSGLHIYLHLRLNTNGVLEDWHSVSYFLIINDNSRPFDYNFFENFKKQRLPLERWVENKIHEKRKIENSIESKLYAPAGIKILGSHGVSSFTTKILLCMLDGMVKNEKIIHLYKIRHVVGKDYRAYSFALLFEKQWFLFPDFVGKDSGGARLWYKSLEERIKEIENNYDKFYYETIDIDWKSFKSKFLEKENDYIKNEMERLPLYLEKHYVEKLEKIMMAKNINKNYISEVIKSRMLLEEAEKRIKGGDFRGSVQDMAESTEFLLKTYNKISKNKTKKIGVGLVEEAYKHYIESKKKSWKDVKHNAELMQIFKVCNIKKHEQGNPIPIETLCLLLFAWRGRKEIIKMILEIND